MNEIYVCNDAMPVVYTADFLVASEPFVHADRTLDFNVLIYVTKGQISVVEEDAEYEINAGELLILKHNVHHYGRRVIEAGTSWYYVHFADNCSDGKNCMQVPKKLTMLLGTSIEQALMDLVDAFSSADRKARWSINCRLYELLSECAFFNEDGGRKTMPLADSVALYLRTNLHLKFSAKHVEKHFFLSYKYLEAVFKTSFRVTMQQYHRSCQMQEACRLLRMTEMTVGEIASELGYADMLYFSRCFSAKIGVCPTQYRKSALKSY